MWRATTLLLLFFICTGTFAQHAKPKAAKPTNKPLVADTVIIKAQVDTTIIPFEPYETNYKNALKAAQSTKQRTNIFKTYLDALHSSTLTAEQKKALLKQKVEHYINIDFYCLYETFLYAAAKEKDLEKAKLFVTVFKNVSTKPQWDAVTEYNKYVVQSAEVQVYNQTTGVTEQLKRPSAWPVGLPLPGYGWGKYASSDDVATPISMQYHLTTTERYNIINGYLKEGKNISPDDLAWHTSYEVNNPKSKPVVVNNQQPLPKTDEQLLREVVGKYFKYESVSYFDCTTCKVISYKSKNEITLKCKYGATKTVKLEELLNNYDKYGFHPATAVLSVCKACNGKGITKSTFSHTNDYQYTLGKKTTYTSTTISNCGVCDGSGYADGF
jgi:hypothetical protein